MRLAVGESSFLDNIIEEIKPGCRKLQMSQIIVNLAETFLGGMISKFQSGSLVCEFKGMGWTRIYSMDMGEGTSYWWDVAKHRVNE